MKILQVVSPRQNSISQEEGERRPRQQGNKRQEQDRSSNPTGFILQIYAVRSCIVFKYILVMRVSLTMEPASEVVGTWRNPPNVRNKKCASVFREQNELWSITIVCANSFRPSQYFCFFILYSTRTSRRKIRQCKMSSFKNIDLKRDFVAGVYLSEAQKPILPSPLHTVYVHNLYLFTQGKGGGGLNQKEG